MPRITISYRREDSGIITGRIFDRLVARYGREAIFRDIDNVPIGVDFRQHIDSTLGATDVLLAIVGPQWVGPRESGSRIQNRTDPVRVELETALRAGTRVVPVLVMGATMPTVDDLPESLHGFAYRNAVHVDTGQDFDVHMDRLIRGVDELLGIGRATPPSQAAPQTPTRLGRSLSLTAAAIVLLLGAGGAAWYFGVLRPGSPQATIATTANSPPSAPPQSTPALPPAVPASPEKSSRAEPRIDSEVVFWQSIESSTNTADFAEYLRKYPDGQFAGLARNRIAVITPPPVREPVVPNSAPPPAAPSAGRCGTLDDQIMQPVRQLYQAVNTKNLDLYAAQWAEGARYVDVARGIQHTKDEKIEERRLRFAAWEAVSLTMNSAVIAQRAPDHAVVNVVYSMTVKNYGRPALGQSNVSEQYSLICGPSDHWLIQANIDENR